MKTSNVIVTVLFLTALETVCLASPLSPLKASWLKPGKISSLHLRNNTQEEGEDSNFGEAFVNALLTVDQCLDSGGTWNVSEAKCECPAGRIAVPRLWDFGSGDSGGIICIPLCNQFGQILNPRNRTCVCDESNDYEVSQFPLAHEDGSARCVKPVKDLRMTMTTGTIDDSGTDDRFFLQIWSSILSAPFVIRFGDEGELSLNAGDIDVVQPSHPDSDITVIEDGKDLADLRYPDDFFTVAVRPDPEKCRENLRSDASSYIPLYGLHHIYNEGTFDGWYLSRLKIEVLLVGESEFQTVYNNTSVDTWVDLESDRGHVCDVEHAFSDRIN